MKMKMICVIAVLTAAILLSGCGISGSSSSSITVSGSSALEPLVQEGANEFMAKNTGVSIKVQDGGSGVGLSQVAAKSCDIGDSDLYAADMISEQQASLLIDHRICVVGFAIVTSSDVAVTNLTTQQLTDIFTGKITNWKGVGGDDEEIVILKRPASSGTRAIFDKYVLGGTEEASGVALMEESSQVLKSALAVNKGAISYLALPYVDSTVKTLQYNGVEPTAENIENGKYHLWSYEHMYTNGEAAETVKAFLEFMAGQEFAPEITKLGYIPITEMKVSG